jgi:hypothetical protein
MWKGWDSHKTINLSPFVLCSEEVNSGVDAFYEADKGNGVFAPGWERRGVYLTAPSRRSARPVRSVAQHNGSGCTQSMGSQHQKIFKLNKQVATTEG